MTPDNVSPVPPIGDLLSRPLPGADETLTGGGADTLPAPAETDDPQRAVRECLELLGQLWAAPAGRPQPGGAGQGLRLGRFEIVGEVGRGGFGVVYRARDARLGRDVALKVPRPEAVMNPEAMRRFVREARASAGLDHQGIVTVLEAGSIGPIGYIASTFCEGPTLDRWLRSRSEPVPSRVAARLIAAMARAVQHAHDRGVLHRDLKPSNVLLQVSPGGADPVPRITDFGLAKFDDEPGEETRSQVLVGTPAYMAPEQASGRRREVGPRADVYALGVVLYQVLVGRPPFSGESQAETIRRVVEDDPIAPRALRPGLPRDLETICLTCLRKEPERRYASAAALADDLERWLDGRPIRARPAPAWERALKWAYRRPVHAAAAALLALTAAGLALGMVWSNAWLRSHNDRLRREIERADRHARLSDRHLDAARLRLAGQAIELGQEERAQEILGAVSDGPHGFVYHRLRALARRRIVLLRGHSYPVRSLAVSPDGRAAASADREGELILWDLAAERPRARLSARPRGAQAPRFSPDGRLLAALEEDESEPDRLVGVSLWDAATGRLLARLPRTAGEDVARLAFRGDGSLETLVVPAPGRVGVRVWDLAPDPSRPRAVAALGDLDGASDAPGAPGVVVQRGGELVLYDVRAAGVRRTFPAPEVLPWSAYALSPDGRRLASARPGNQVVVWDVATGAELGVRQLDAPAVRVAWAPAGGALAVVDASGLVHLDPGAGGRPATVRPDDRDETDEVTLAFSPDGSRLALYTSGLRGPRSDVTLWDVTAARRLAVFPGRPELIDVLDFTRDGRALFLDNGPHLRLWRPDADPDAGRPAVVGHHDEAWAVAFSPDGRVLASGCDDDVELTIRLWDAATGRPLRGWHGHPATVSALAFSPDGRTLASAALGPRDNLRLWDPATGRLRADLAGHTDRVRSVAFRPDGGLLASAGSDRVVRLWDPRSGRAAGALIGHEQVVRCVAFSPDGRTLASAANDRTVRVWDLATGRGRRALTGPESFVSVVFSADGATIAAADEAGTITLADPATGTRTGQILGDDGALRCLALAPDGRTLAAAGATRAVRLWDLESQQELLALDGLAAPVNSLAFAPDGRALASASHDGDMVIWRAGEARAGPTPSP